MIELTTTQALGLWVLTWPAHIAVGLGLGYLSDVLKNIKVRIGSRGIAIYVNRD